VTATIAQVRDFLRYDTTDSDETLTIMMQAGQDWVERHSGYLLTEREVTQQSSFGPIVDLLWKPFAAPSLAVAYLDGSFVDQAFTSFVVRSDGRVLPTSAWPATKGATLTYTAGFASADDVPASMIHAICLYCAMSDEDRGNIDANAWQSLRNVLGDYWRPVIA